ncbi:MAG: hypothetical protein AB7I30_05940 [Isosphaeraceae bacterium]
MRARAAVGLLTLLVGLATCGCIEGKRLNLVRYDRDSDTFHVVEIYVNLATKEKKELDHVADLWARKADLIVNPGSWFTIFGSPTLLERKEPHSYKVVNVATPDGNEPKTHETAADLDAVKVKPGEFFLNEHRTLCYYHEVTVPGAVVDVAMREVVPDLAEFLASFAEDQIRQSGKENSVVETWDEIRASFLSRAERKPEKPASDEENAKSKRSPLEQTSLRLLIKAGVDRTLPFSRSGDRFSITLPLSPRDCDEAVATIDLMREVLAEVKEETPDEKGIAEFLRSLEASHLKGVGLRVTVPAEALSRLEAARFDVTPDPARKQVYRTTAASIQGRGITINRTDLLPDLLKRFGPLSD